MAGQPQEPSWQPTAQDQTRPAWQSYPPPSNDKHDTYAYPQPTAAQGYGQSYSQPGQGYPGPSYPAQDQGYPGPNGQPGSQWQASAGKAASAARAKAHGNAKGFLGALFDFSFTSFVTPKIIKVLYVLITIWTVIWALVFLRLGFKYGGAAGGFFTLLIVDPILVLLTLGVYRVVLELFMVVHRMHDDLKAIRERDDRG